MTAPTATQAPSPLTPATRQPIALFSAYNKTGIEKYARILADRGVKIVSTSRTLKYIQDNGIDAVDISTITGFPSIMKDRVKTLHPAVHGGMLALDTDEHKADLASVGGEWIDLVFIDLYPLEDEVAKEEATLESITEQTDIGGPAMLRSAAKGRRLVFCDHADAEEFIERWPDMSEEEQLQAREYLAAKAEARVAQYAGVSANAISGGRYSGEVWESAMPLGYAENRWITGGAAVAKPFRIGAVPGQISVDEFQQVSGQLPGYINIADADSCLMFMAQISDSFDQNGFAPPAVAIAVKHGNACGVGVSSDPVVALRKMITGDLEAIHGATVMVNFPVDGGKARLLRSYKVPGGSKSKPRLLDAVWAPSFSDSAEEVLERKAGKCRMMVHPRLGAEVLRIDSWPVRRRQLRNGRVLVQGNYNQVLKLDDPRLVKHGSKLTERQRCDMLIAAAVCMSTASNVITLVKDGQVIGTGAYQTSRKRACELAVKIALDNKHSVRGAVAGSDSFFPFPDGPEILINAGVFAIYTTSGSVNDKLTQELCKKRKVKLVWGPDAEFRMFSKH